MVNGMPDQNVWARRVARLFLFAFVVGAPAAASAATIDFEGLACQSTFAIVGGFTFSSSWITECDGDYEDPTAWANTTGAPSATTAAGNTYSGDPVGVTISRAQPFNLVGGMASAFLINDDFDFTTPISSSSLLIEGYFNNAFVDSLTVIFDPASGGAGPGYHAIGSLSGINELRFFSAYDRSLSAGPDYWLVDDLQFTDSAAPPSAVPEPSGIWLLGAGISVLMAGTLRARRRVARPLKADSSN